MCSLGTYAAALLALLLREIRLFSTIGYLFIPAAAIAAYLLRLEFQPNRLRGSPVLLLRDVAFFTLGVLVPLFIFVSFYGSLGGLGALLRGIFILPQQRFGHHAALTQSNLKFLGGLILDTILIWSIFFAPSAFARKARLSASIGLAAAIVAAIKFSAVQKGIWSLLWNLLPIAVLAGLALLLFGRTKAAYRQKLFLLLSVTAGCSIKTVPVFCYPSYFCYVAPLAVVTCSTILAILEGPPRLLRDDILSSPLLCVIRSNSRIPESNGILLRPAMSKLASSSSERAGGLRVLPKLSGNL